jgi:hypothetical protein
MAGLQRNFQAALSPLLAPAMKQARFFPAKVSAHASTT